MTRPVRIDVHTHVVVDLPNFAGRFGDARWPTFHVDGGVGSLVRGGQVVRSLAENAWLPEKRIDDMEAAGIAGQVLSPVPPLICDWADPQPATEWANRLNEGIAEIVGRFPARFLGLGTVPLNHPGQAVKVLQRAHDAGLSGVQIGTRAGHRELDDEHLSEFFSAAEDLDMLIFVHPLLLGGEIDWTNRISDPAVAFGLGMGTDTAIAASRLSFGGVVRRCPDLRICLAHGGGTFAWALPRIARLWDGNHDQKAADLVKNVFVDSVVYDAANLQYLCRQLGADRVLFGTDYPLPAQDDQAGSILDVLAPDDAERVASGNMAFLRGASRLSGGCR